MVLGLWQFLVLATSIGVLLGKGQAVEWGETPTGFKPGTLELNFIPGDALIAVGALLVAAHHTRCPSSGSGRSLSSIR